jgi:NTP pyrophosphatase (non-canonical NTP hydrolase)
VFAIGDARWPGISKLVEEIGELGQVLGKLMGSRGNIAHWSGNLSDMLHEEAGDVLGAIEFVIRRCKLDRARIEKRAAMKVAKFEEWHTNDPDPRGK